MFVIKFACVIFIGFVAFCQATNIVPCYKDDLHCVSVLHKQIISGFPEYGIPSADTVTLPELTIGDTGLTLKNIVVTGFGNQNLNSFQRLPDGSTMLISGAASIQIHADVVFHSRFNGHNAYFSPNVYTGQYNAKANILSHTLFQYDFKHDAHGSEYYNIGSEVILGGVYGQPEASLQFHEHTPIDPFIHSSQINNMIIKKVVENSYSSVIRNIRSIADTLPRGTFFYDL